MKKCLICILLLLSPLCWSKEREENLMPLISPEAIAEKIKETAQQINKTYQNEPLTVIMIMKGALFLTADLIRNLQVPVTLEYLQTNTYETNKKSDYELTLSGLEQLQIRNKNVLVVDDVYDSGKTLSMVLKALEKQNPKSLQSLVLLAKNPSKTSSSCFPNYILFHFNQFTDKLSKDNLERIVVGYGIDYEERYRELPGIYLYKNSKK